MGNQNNNNPKKRVVCCKSFHFRYLELCRAKNYPPSTEIKSKNNATSTLDFFGDKLKVDDWLFVIESLRFDQVLQNLAIRLRKNLCGVIEHIDNEKKARLFKQKPAVFTKYIFTGIVEAIANCIQFNKNLTVLCLEALPLTEKHATSIAKALSANEQLRHISFQRSPIGDKGSEVICSTIKYLANVDTLDLSECQLSVKAAEHISDMIKFQKICRYSDGWQRSLRYRDVDPNTMPGLRVILMSRNQGIGDEGVEFITEILKEDAWIKFIDMENCGITDVGANLILNCLEINNSIIDFNIRNNVGVSEFLRKNIRQKLGKDEGQSNEDDNKNKMSKVSVAHLKEQLKFLEEKIASEKLLRKQAELLNEKLHRQIIEYEVRLQENLNLEVPEGFVLVKNESLESIIKERNSLHEASVKAKIIKTKHFLSKIRRTKSEDKYKQLGTSNKMSKSNYEIKNTFDKKYQKRQNNIVFEENIGDSIANHRDQQLTARIDKSIKQFEDIDSPSESNDFSERDTNNPIKVYIRKKQNCEDITTTNTANKDQFSLPRSMFLGLS